MPSGGTRVNRASGQVNVPVPTMCVSITTSLCMWLAPAMMLDWIKTHRPDSRPGSFQRALPASAFCPRENNRHTYPGWFCWWNLHLRSQAIAGFIANLINVEPRQHLKVSLYGCDLFVSTMQWWWCQVNWWNLIVLQKQNHESSSSTVIAY